MCRSFRHAVRNSIVFAAAVVGTAGFLAPALAAAENFGSLNVSRERIRWASPSDVARDLRSPNDDVRQRALVLIGVPESLVRIRMWSQAQQPAVTGWQVAKPQPVQLLYAALGGDDTQQAIVAAVVLGVYAFAAVASPSADGWVRIASFGCWCKYDSDVLDTFLSLSRAPGGNAERYELVLRASGGGSGLYQQDETRFRFHGGEMKAVMSFVSRVQAVTQADPVSRLRIERRWFYQHLSTPGRVEPVAVLVESRGESNVPPPINFVLRDLQVRFLRRVACRTFRWDEKEFEYKPVTVANACEVPE